MFKNEDWIKSEGIVKVDGRDEEFFTYVHKDDPLAKLFVDNHIDVV
ncbi:MAG: hypothetical protein HY307_04815 [Arcobacter sp.]|nr:hypothetical protein [Arcobacter sp.]